MKLDSIKKSEYSGDYESTILEQWKICVDAAHKVSERRNNTNNIFITINAALFALTTFTLDYKSILLSAIGIVICILWICSINSYKELNKVKFEIINEIEERLPLAPFDYEWKTLRLEQKYVNLTKIEKILPWIFLFLYAISILWPIFKLLLKFICPCVEG